MSTISQSVLMAITVTVNKFASSNVHAVQRIESNKKTSLSSSTFFGRRGIFLSSLVAAYPVIDSRTELLQKYLKKTEENKSKNDKERLDSYYKRNYQDYFNLVEGGLKGKKEEDLSESEKAILEWLKNNK
ncbi:uncharacterized protein LOC126659881 [Mercurialis annua]|uniref:uncharacterized protein LOC126659881 n=1 Tax=Mercurialis annua TaxID=3986 RepID=UPI00215E3FBF|nr:uncharacterized protein LOC126659881 [Mercurialis annua]